MECMGHKWLVLMVVAVMVMMAVIVMVRATMIFAIVTYMAIAGFRVMFMRHMSIIF